MTSQYKKIQWAFAGFGALCLMYNLYEWIGHKYSPKQGATFVLEASLGLFLIFAPTLFNRFFRLTLPEKLIYFYWFFLFISVFLGTSLHFISMIQSWDKVLHFVSPMLLTAIGYGIAGYFLRDTSTKDLSPWLYLLFGFAFAGLCGVFWEFWEFLCDSVANMNLQRYAASGGKPFIGRAALMDTMGDLFTNTIGAAVFLVISWMLAKKQPDYFKQFQLG